MSTSRWWRHLRQSLRRWLGGKPDIPDSLWQKVWQRHPFLHHLDASEQVRLRELCQGFLASKEFNGAHGVRISDVMALTIALQACVLLLHWGEQALAWYDDFVGIVVHPNEMWAPREVMDEAGVVHHYREALLGEAMEGGPVTLAWSSVASAADEASRGHNLVIHEFAHKLDMRGKSHGRPPDGCPPLPRGFMGHTQAGNARRHWRQTLHAAHERHRQRVEMNERFGAEPPWLDSYGAHSPSEFFAVACEAYFVNRACFEAEWPEVCALFDAFFRPGNRLSA